MLRPPPRLDFMSRISVGVQMTSHFCTMVKWAHHSRASAPATSATSGEVNCGSARRSAASISGGSRVSIRLSACSHLTGCRGIAGTQRGGRG